MDDTFYSATRYTPEYETFLNRRYADLKQIFEAVVSYCDPDETEENHLFMTIEAELDALARMLGYETPGEMLARLSEDYEDDDV